MIETIYRVDDKEFKDYELAKAYDLKNGILMFDVCGVRVFDYVFAAYIVTTNEEQTNYMREKYHINLYGPYGFYVWMGDIKWIRINNDVMKEVAKQFV